MRTPAPRFSCSGMPGWADLVHLTRRGIDYKKQQVPELTLHHWLRFRAFCACSLLIGVFIAAGVLSAQDVQMIPDQQDRDSANKAQQNKDEDQDPAETLKVNVDVVQF